MALWNAFRGRLARFAAPRRRPHQQERKRRTRRPVLETLEDRVCLSTTIDTQALANTLPLLVLDTTSIHAGGPQIFDLSPGPHTLRSAQPYGGSVDFTVAGDGTVSYDESNGLAGLLSGANTTTLTVNGRTVAIDATALSLPVLDLNEEVTVRNGTPFATTILPGVQFLASAQGYGGSAVFSVANDGTVSYDESNGLAGLLSGAGTSTLTVNGRTVAIDATALSLPLLDLNEEVNFPSAAPFTATVLPGVQYLYSATGYGGGVLFSVANEGTLDYSFILNETLSGRGTPQLAVLGDSIQIDARALSSTTNTFTLTGIGTYPTGVVAALTLLPGWESFSAAAETLDFHVDEFSRVDYDPINDALVSGRGTSTLVLLPQGGNEPNIGAPTGRSASATSAAPSGVPSAVNTAVASALGASTRSVDPLEALVTAADVAAWGSPFQVPGTKQAWEVLTLDFQSI
jgi:hypothetical protein